MDDVAVANTENEEDKKIRERLLQWESGDDPLAPITTEQQEIIDKIEELLQEAYYNADDIPDDEEEPVVKEFVDIPCKTFKDLFDSENKDIKEIQDFFEHYENVGREIVDAKMDVYHKYVKELKKKTAECDSIVDQIDASLSKLDELEAQYEQVQTKTSSLNSVTEKLTEEHEKLDKVSVEIQRRLYYFTKVESISQTLQNPVLSVTSETFRDILDKIDECLEYLRQNQKFKEAGAYIVKYKHCLARALTMIKNYSGQVLAQASESVLVARSPTVTTLNEGTNPETAFALYYGKFQTSSVKIKKVSLMLEERIGQSPEYEQLLAELHQNYLSERATIMSPAVDKAIKDLKVNHKGDHCSLMRSACAFLVHVCQDEHRLFYQFFTIASEQLNTYLEGLCVILHDTLRPYIIHINHLETLAEICSILRIEMLEEQVQQNTESLEAFGKTVHQLLQDVQERLVFRAHLYLQSDILNYNPSGGDLAYPDKLEMMESIALSLQEPQPLKRSDSKSSLISSVSSAVPESVVDNNVAQKRFMNSPADLHGMWYPTVRRTLVCLSRLYRCVDRPIFQGLSQEALNYCIQSVSNAGSKISASKSRIDGELFEIKHLLILREQIAPFRVDFTVKETTLDFSKVKTAAFELLHKRKQLFSMGSNNALLEFLLDGTPLVKEHLIDSRKDVDRQLKFVCEMFIRDSVQMLVRPVLGFLEKAHNFTQAEQQQQQNQQQQQQSQKLNYQLRQSAWASPQQISGCIQESQRLIKSKLAGLQRSMQLYLSNKDTEFIIFRPIRNNIINAFVRLEQLLVANGYTKDDMIVASCPTPDQVSLLLSSASILADTNQPIAMPSSASMPATPAEADSEPKMDAAIEKQTSVDETTEPQQPAVEGAEHEIDKTIETV